jgi:hypothetical protein
MRPFHIPVRHGNYPDMDNPNAFKPGALGISLPALINRTTVSHSVDT